MKRFLKKLLLLVLPIFVIGVAGLLLPATPRARTSMLFEQKHKDMLLRTTPGPRIVFVGASSTSFGMNSQLIKDAFNINPIDMGLNVALGIRFYTASTLPSIREGDIVVATMDYRNSEPSHCSQELFRMIFDVDKKYIAFLDWRQCLGMPVHVPHYIFTKFNPREYLSRGLQGDGVYNAIGYNQYGDATRHWYLPREKYAPDHLKALVMNGNVDMMKKFQSDVEARGARFFVTYPGYQKTSFDLSIECIRIQEAACRAAGFHILGTPERYCFPDEFTFNHPSHLTKAGVDRRTALLIEDLRKEVFTTTASK
jgi:hypothetical protein